MAWEQLTGWILIATVGALLLYNGAIAIFAPHRATISNVVSKSARRWPVIAFAAGFVCGHWFWPL